MSTYINKCNKHNQWTKHETSILRKKKIIKTCLRKDKTSNDNAAASRKQLES